MQIQGPAWVQKPGENGHYEYIRMQVPDPEPAKKAVETHSGVGGFLLLGLLLVCFILFILGAIVIGAVQAITPFLIAAVGVGGTLAAFGGLVVTVPRAIRGWVVLIGLMAGIWLVWHAIQPAHQKYVAPPFRTQAANN